MNCTYGCNALIDLLFRGSLAVDGGGEVFDGGGGVAGVGGLAEGAGGDDAVGRGGREVLEGCLGDVFAFFESK